MMTPFPMDPEGFYKIPADGKVVARHAAALHNIKIARRTGRKYAEDYYMGYADALSNMVAKKRAKADKKRAEQEIISKVNGTPEAEA
jgi:hypothetical protein